MLVIVTLVLELNQDEETNPLKTNESKRDC